MLNRGQHLPRDPDILVGMVLERDAEIERLKGMLKAANAQPFGQKSEKSITVLEGQIRLDLGDAELNVEVAAANDEPKPAREPGQASAKSQPRRNLGALPEHLERVVEVIEPSSLECACCQGQLHRIGEEESEALASRPATLYVLRTVRPKYACRACEAGIVQAKARPRLFDGGLATTSMISNVVVWRYAWYLPLHRQVQMLKGQGVRLDTSTLCGWVKRSAWWLKTLYDKLLAYIHSHSRVFVDETRMPVLKKGRKRTKTCQFWAHAVDDRPWNGPAYPAVAYVFAQGRGKAEIQSQLVNYRGLLQVDAYKAYKSLTRSGRRAGKITLAYCLAHARRKFVDVFKKYKSELAKTVLERLAEIYAIEAKIRGTSAEHRLSVRQAKTRGLMADLKVLLVDTIKDISAKDPVASAIRYTLGLWSGLTLFLDDGRLEVDSNTVERNMRSIALGRVNSLFAGSDGGAESWAILGSLLTTAKLNGLDPYTWLNDVLERIVSGEIKSTSLERCLPWHWKREHADMNLAVAA
ncbi:IS66 family transposase [Rhizobium sp. LjRoot98]|uniref:IS66 family transposase n=1 Tax=Rhizobium sp. LjRoot98 TaxID=3342345 RepID=UPI000DD62EC9